MSTHSVLLQVRALLSEESRWNKGAYAITAANVRCKITDPEAVKWCIQGAISLYENNNFVKITNFVRERAGIKRMTLAGYNDSKRTTHKSLLRRLDKAIAKAKNGRYNMPLKKGRGKEVMGENISKLVGEGYPEDQAVAIAYDKAGKKTRTPKRKKRSNGSK